jgi:NTP pyrophosphatase (non-canonical NTP hydrolase)
MRENRHFQHASADEITEQNEIDDQTFIEQVGTWTNKNFTYHNPLQGLIEEFGEMTHCLLKRSQKIRGYDDPDKFQSEYADALSDFCIYAAHLAYLNPKVRTDYSLDTHQFYPKHQKETADLIVPKILRELAHLTDSPIPAGQLKIVLNHVSQLAFLEGFDLRDITFSTWEKIVSKRDWTKTPTGV